MKFLKKNKKIVILISVGVLLILSGILSWNLYFSKFKIFKDNEKLFLETVERYYSMNSNYLPEKNGTREMTLQKLYEGHHITDLYVPKTKKLCDSNSWVRVYQDENGKFSYTTYLKCGKFESNVDHTGPEITLNGESEITLALGSTYQEPGVSKVYDKVDGNLNTSDVVIDSSSLDINKVGNYKIAYTIRDKSYNKTVVTRMVIVARNLTNVVKDATDDSNYYKGLDPNNYLLFSGMLFRIVNVNSDGSVKIVSYDNISNVTYGNQDSDFNDSNIKAWLNKEYYNALTNPDPYIKKDSSWCIDSTMDSNSIFDACTSVANSTVGLLTISDWNKSLENNQTYLNTIGEYWFLTRHDNYDVYVHNLYNNGINKLDSTLMTGVKPAIQLKENLYIISGNGTRTNPYRLGDYDFGKAQDLLSTRLIGEYVNYSGMLFRISGFDDKKNIKLTSIGFLGNATTDEIFYVKYENENKAMKFNPEESGNIAYKLNNEYIDFIDDSLIINHSYSLYQYSRNAKYTDYPVVDTFKAKLSIPSSFDLFSSVDNNFQWKTNYWLLDYIDGENSLMINSSNGRSFNIYEGYYDSNSFKLTFYLKNTAKISSGTGVSWNPYVIK